MQKGINICISISKQKIIGTCKDKCRYVDLLIFMVNNRYLLIFMEGYRYGNHLNLLGVTTEQDANTTSRSKCQSKNDN